MPFLVYLANSLYVICSFDRTPICVVSFISGKMVLSIYFSPNHPTIGKIPKLLTLQLPCIISFSMSPPKNPDFLNKLPKSIQFLKQEHMKQNPKRLYTTISENSLTTILSLTQSICLRALLTPKDDETLALQVFSK